jgi:hypothetical protein
VLPRSVATKFSGEYMAPFLFIEAIRKRLPWIKARREGLVAITFKGDIFKPERLVQYQEGELLRYKSLKARWEYSHYADFYR